VFHERGTPVVMPTRGAFGGERSFRANRKPSGLKQVRASPGSRPLQELLEIQDTHRPRTLR